MSVQRTVHLRLPLDALFVLLGRELWFPDESFQSETFLSRRGTEGPDAGKEAQTVSDLDCVMSEDRFEIIDLEPGENLHSTAG